MCPHATVRRHRWPAALAGLLLATALTACGGSFDDLGGSTRGPSIPGVLPTPVTTSPPSPYITDEPTDEPSEQPTEQPTDEETEEPGDGQGEDLISGHAYTRGGAPLAGAMVYIYVLPRTYGTLYRAQTRADGSYSYAVPGGVYLVQAAVDNDNPNLIVDLVPRQTLSDGVASVSVPPSQVIDFDAP
jgi:hypothetical protein